VVVVVEEVVVEVVVYDMIVHAFNPSSWEAEVGGLQL
jgi:hypothetical protein